MKTVSTNDFMAFYHWSLETPDGRAKFRAITNNHEEWTALDVLSVDAMSAKDKLSVVLRENFIDASALHEFACRCADAALSISKGGSGEIGASPDFGQSTIAVKRAWLRGEASDEDMLHAWDYAATLSQHWANTCASVNIPLSASTLAGIAASCATNFEGARWGKTVAEICATQTSINAAGDIQTSWSGQSNCDPVPYESQVMILIDLLKEAS